VDRFWEKVDMRGHCWEWTAAKTSCGYGRFKVEGKTVGAHRVSYELHYGEIPEEMCVLHTCDTPPCVNPEHLFLGTPTDNNRDRDQKGRNGFSNKTHCPQGHPYGEDNLYLRSNGQRVCKACTLERNRVYQEKNKEKILEQKRAYYVENRESILETRKARQGAKCQQTN